MFCCRLFLYDSKETVIRVEEKSEIFPWQSMYAYEQSCPCMARGNKAFSKAAVRQRNGAVALYTALRPIYCRLLMVY